MQIVVPTTPTYTVRADQVWCELSWASSNTRTNPLQVKVTITNRSTTPLTVTDAPSLKVVPRPGGWAPRWTGRPSPDPSTCPCGPGPNLSVQLLGGHTMRPAAP
ncbi:MAG: hypothetical protein ACYCXN_06480 [Acidimicrobiales bacterium]